MAYKPKSMKSISKVASARPLVVEDASPNAERIEEIDDRLSEINSRLKDLNDSESDAAEEYDEMLNDIGQECKVGNLSYDPSQVLKECDPTAYRIGFSDWADEEIGTLETEKEELEDQKKELEEED